MRNKVCISGASGFFGKNIINYLEPNFNINAISIRYNDKPITAISGDSYIHLSGKAHDLRNVSNPEEYYNSNFKLTKEVYEEFLKSDCKKFIFISSVKAVVDHLQEPLEEEYSPNPRTHYGKSKLMAEEFIQSQPLPNSKSYCILRPCMIHGPGNKGNLNLLYNIVSK